MELKFRVWDVIRKEFLDLNRNQITIQCENGIVYFPGSDSVYGDDCYIAQVYSGLNDREGVEIYEGDIIQFPEFVSEIKFFHGSFMYEVPSLNTSVPIYNSVSDLWVLYAEVIGNIFENPELLPK